MMNTNKGVNEAHYHDPILEASEEHVGGQVIEKMASPWKRRSLSPNRDKHIVQAGTLILIREIQLDTFVPLLQWEIFAPWIVRCRECAGRQR